MAGIGEKFDNIAGGSVAVDVSSTDADLTYESCAIFVGGAGDINLRMASGDIVFTCPAGALLPIRCDKIYNASTTATGIVALF